MFREINNKTKTSLGENIIRFKSMEKKSMKKFVFLTMMFGLSVIASRDASASQGFVTAIESKATTEYLTGSFGLTNTYKDLNSLARKYIPNGTKIIHKVVQGKFAQSATGNSGNVVVMYRDKSGSKFGEYNTMVLVPKGASWERYFLPQPDATWSFMKPLAVFFENVDKDRDMELLVLEETESGAGPDGAKPFYRTRIYDWSGSGFVHLEDISDKISTNADTVAKVRRELKRIIR